MKLQLLELREKLQLSLWFIPALICLALLALGLSLQWDSTALPQ